MFIIHSQEVDNSFINHKIKIMIGTILYENTTIKIVRMPNGQVVKIDKP
jgi:hypothetical protein